MWNETEERIIKRLVFTYLIELDHITQVRKVEYGPMNWGSGAVCMYVCMYVCLFHYSQNG